MLNKYQEAKPGTLEASLDDRASLVAQLVKNPPAMREIRVQSYGWEGPLEKGKAPVFWPREFHELYSHV